MCIEWTAVKPSVVCNAVDLRETKPRYDVNCRCICSVCGVVSNPQSQQQQELQELDSTQQPQPLIRTCTNGFAGVSPSAAQNAATKTVDSPRQATNILATDRSINNGVQQQQQNHHHHQHQQPIPAVAHQHQWFQQQQQPFNPMYYPPMPQHLTPCPPWMMAAPMQVAAAARFCCSHCRSWFNRVGRRGRPPHDDHCGRPTAASSGNPGGNAECNPGWKAIW